MVKPINLTKVLRTDCYGKGKGGAGHGGCPWGREGGKFAEGSAPEVRCLMLAAIGHLIEPMWLSLARQVLY